MPWVKVLPQPVLAMVALAVCVFVTTACAPSNDNKPADAAGPAKDSLASAPPLVGGLRDDAPEHSPSFGESDSNALDSSNVGESSDVTDKAIPATELGASKFAIPASSDISQIEPSALASEEEPDGNGEVAAAGTVALGDAPRPAAESEVRSVDQTALSGPPTAEIPAQDTGFAEAGLVAEEVGPKNIPQDPGADDTVAASAAVAPVPLALSGEQSTVEAGPPESPPVDPCTQFDTEHDTWLDRSNVGIYRTVCGATAWFDGFFGDRRYDQATAATYGRISMGGYWDQLNGFDPRLRFRARFALPSIRNRGALLIGRGDEQDVIEERNTSLTDQIPTEPNPNQNEDVSTFVGFGWDQLASLTRGLSFSAGLKLRTPIEPIIKVKYRRNWQLTDRDLLSIRPLVYWRNQEGLGATVQLDVDHVINNAFLFRWANFGNVSEDEEVEGVNWGTTFYLYQALSEKQALTYSIFASGSTDAPITFQNTGFQFRYRQRILRKWLFIEYFGGMSWPRAELEDKRESNFGSGLRLEAYFGPAPDNWMR